MRSKVLIICVIICHSAILFAQNRDDRYHNFGSEKYWKIKAYIGPMIILSGVEGNFSADLGATGGFIIKNKFRIGFYGQKLVTRPPRTDLARIGYSTFTDGQIKMIQGGGVLAYIHKPEEVIHWGISGSAGLGILYLYAKNPVTKNLEKIYDDRVYIAIPRLFVESNMTRWFKVNVSAGYHYVGKINGTYTNQALEIIPTFNKSDYNKPEFSISLLVGNFGNRSSVLF
jgi:hypothetical protein